MDKFKNIREVTSPHSFTNSPHDAHHSLIINRDHTTEINPTKLDFKSSASKIESKFSNMHMIQSQVMPGNATNSTYKNQKTGFGNESAMFNMQSSLGGRFGTSNVTSGSRVVDPMKESTISYIRSISRGINNISEERLREISDNFLRLYGTEREITKNGARNIQREAHSDANTGFQQTSETVDEIFRTLDGNRDGRVSHEDITNAARRYLSFEKKMIVYTPMVEQRLAVARRLFKQFDVERKGYLTEKQVPNLLSETYKCLGKTFTATQEDVRSWMKLTDGDNDGLVTLPQYEQSIIRALKKQGVRIYDD